MSELRVLVCGGRDYGVVRRNDSIARRGKALKERRLLDYVLDAIDHRSYGYADYQMVIINGAAQGADTLSSMWAETNMTTLLEYPADWERNGVAAGNIRNQQMLDEAKPHMVVAFPGGKGTMSMMGKAAKAGVPVLEVDPDMTLLTPAEVYAHVKAWLDKTFPNLGKE